MERNIHELLIILRDNIEVKRKFIFWKRINSGLCEKIFNLYIICIINFEEYKLLKEYLTRNTPRILGSHYYWKKRLYRPRKKWLDKHIKLTKNL